MLNLTPLPGCQPVGSEPPAVALPTGETWSTRQVCQKFEAYFTASLFNAMAKNINLGQTDGWMKAQSEWAWNGLVQQVADTLARGEGLGLAKVLEQKLAQQELKSRPGA